MLKIHRFLAHLIYQDHFIWNKKIIAKEYFKTFHRKLNFHRLDTFNAFLQQVKINKNTENLWPLVDKYLVRQHVAKLVGEQYLPKLLGVWEKPEEIQYEQLPAQYVLKTNHGSSWNVIVKDSKNIDQNKINKQLKKWLSRNFYSKTLEPQYRYIQPKIFGEELLMDANGELLDYKIFCFFGQPCFIQVNVDRFTPQHSELYFNLNWDLLPFTLVFPMGQKKLNPPKNLAEMIDIAKKLAENHSFVRVDLYNIDGRILFGELTFTPGNGYSHFFPNDTYDYIMGDFLAGRIDQDEFNRILKMPNLSL